jgi:hypothetical protein
MIVTRLGSSRAKLSDLANAVVAITSAMIAAIKIA